MTVIRNAGSLGASHNGTATAASILDASGTNDRFSFENERGFFDLATEMQALSAIQFRGGDPAGANLVRYTNSTARYVDQSRTGTARQMQPGRCALFNGTADEITVASVGNVQHISMRIKFAATNQEILALQDSTATAVTVVAGVLTFGGSLTGSNIYVDGVSKTAAQAGALLNDLEWHRLDFDLASISASSVVVGQDGGTGFGNFYLHDLRMDSATWSAAQVATVAAMTLGVDDVGETGTELLWWKLEEGAGPLVLDSSGNGKNGTFVSAAITTSRNATVNDQYSFANEIGFSEEGTYFSGSLNLTGPRYSTTVVTKLSGSAWVRALSTATGERFIFGEDNTTAGKRGWVFYMNAGKLWLLLSGDGVSFRGYSHTSVTLNDNTWHHVGFTYNADVAALYIDGSSVSVTYSGSAATSLFYDVDHKAVIGHTGGVIDWIGQIAGVAWEAGTVWSAGTFTALNAAGRTDHSSVPASAFLIPLADGVETQQSKPPLAVEAGTLYRSYVPRDESDTANEIIGNALDYTGQCPHDPLIDSPCVTLNGTSDFVNFGDVAAADVGTGDFSYSLWFRTTSSGQGALWTKSTGGGGAPYGIYFYFDAGSIKAFISPTTVTFSASGLNDGEWHHLLFVRDAGTLKLYVDGTIDATTAAHSLSLSNSQPLRIGAWSASPFGYADMRIARAGAWAVALDADDATTLYARGTVSGAFITIDCCEGSGTTIYDRSGNANHGTATFASEVAAWANQQDVTDTLITDGYRLSSGVNIPMLLSGASAADGGALTNGPGVLAPNQSLDFAASEASSPFALQLDAILADLIYDQADDDEADALFARTTASQDDRIIVTIPALTGANLTNMTEYCT